jgi:hypothetical protein
MTQMPIDFQPILNHIQKYFGSDGFLVQNPFNDVKILIIPPNKKRNYALYITLGISERPMFDLPDLSYVGAVLRKEDNPLRGAFKDNYAELMVKLPLDWPLPSLSGGINDDDYFWPISYMFELGDFVHEEKTIFRAGHTFGYDKNFTFAKNTKLAGWLFTQPQEISSDFARLKINSTKIVSFLQLIPLYLEELLYAEKYSTEELRDKLKANKIPDHIIINRINTCSE